MRSAAESSKDRGEKKKDEESVSLFWRLFGGTLLSMVVLISITLYNHMSSNIAELRTEVSREREARGEFIKKEEFNSRVNSQYERIRGLDAVKLELEALKERGNTNAANIEALKRDTTGAIDGIRKELTVAADAVKKEASSNEILRERVLALEALKKEIASLETIRERLTSTTADLKLVRDEMNKLSSDVEKNKASDMERKILRDSQYKQMEDSLKELQKAIQDCREKLVRLEATKPTASEQPVPTPRPAIPNDSKPAPENAPGEFKPHGGSVVPGSSKPTPESEGEVG